MLFVNLQYASKEDAVKANILGHWYNLLKYTPVIVMRWVYNANLYLFVGLCVL